MKVEEIEKKLELLFENTDYEIVDVKIIRGKNLILQVFIDRNNGKITLKDCEIWSEKIGAFIDMNSVIAGAYTLEVSSPGVDRIIKKPKDFEKFKGKDVKIVLKKPVEGIRIYYSKIVGFKDNRAIFENLEFSMDDIEEIRLNPSDDEILKDLKN
ncbi:MAG: ribosome maturation factor RimP [Elusimicrobiales bacterium]|nr:ribosome maturation factor RimP [Elusimicrobiales bacterium]